MPLAPAQAPGNRLGRPADNRLALTAAFLAKAVYGLQTTRQLLEQIRANAQLRTLCGWRYRSHIPHESTLSRAFAEFAQTELPQRLHHALIRATQRDRLIGHTSRHSTAIEARERYHAASSRPAQTQIASPAQARPSLRTRYPDRTPAPSVARAHAARLPTGCSLGVKLHLDVADGQIPISAILTGANVHDCNVAIPLMTMSAQRVTWLYELMDSAYDADAILAHARSLEHVPVVDPHPGATGDRSPSCPRCMAPRAPRS